METKLAALFAFLGFGLLISTWLVRSVADLAPMPVDHLLTLGCFVFWVYFFLGWGIAKLGISLIQEVLSEKRLREEEERNKARGMYEEAAEEEASKETNETQEETKTPA